MSTKVILFHSQITLIQSCCLFQADTLDPHSELEGEAPDGSFANRNGRHTIGHVDDFSALQQQVLEGRSLVQRMETTLQSCLGPPLMEKKSNELVRATEMTKYSQLVSDIRRASI